MPWQTGQVCHGLCGNASYNVTNPLLHRGSPLC